jgi:catechol 2,3-dioxygenase-like lactoylglutathione lyase family enzyme
MRTAAAAYIRSSRTMTPISQITFGRAAPGIPVRDIQAACDFYVRVFGFRKVFENGNPVGFMILKKDRAEIHLNLKRDHSASTLNVAHILVDNVDALYAICEAAGVRIVKSIADKDYGLRAFVFADPDGNRIDVGQEILTSSA